MCMCGCNIGQPHGVIAASGAADIVPWDSGAWLTRQLGPAVLGLGSGRAAARQRSAVSWGEHTRPESWALGLLLALVAMAAGLFNPHSLGNISGCIRKQ